MNEEQPKKLGRPIGSYTRGDTVRVTVRLTPETADKARHLAQAHNGGNLSLYFEDLITREDTSAPDDQEIARMRNLAQELLPLLQKFLRER